MNAPAQSPWKPPQAPLVAAGDPDAPLYAGFWRRWAAAVVDAILLYVVAVPVFLVVGAGLLGNLVGLLVAWIYHAGMQSSPKQATFGKMAFGIKVTRLDGERASFLRATARYFSTLVSTVLAMIGYLMAAFTQKKQALHDLIAGTLVVRADATPEAVVNGGGTMKITGGVVACSLLLALVPVAGILAAIAIPAYSDYTVRAKMTESVQLAGAARTAVQAFYDAHGRIPTANEAGLGEETRFSRAPSLVSDGRKVRIQVQSRLPEAQGGSVVLESPIASPMTWTCGTDRIPHRYLPASCRIQL